MRSNLLLVLVTGLLLIGQSQAQNPIRGFFNNVVNNFGRIASRLAVVTNIVTEKEYITVTVTVTTTEANVVQKTAVPASTDSNPPSDNVLETTDSSDNEGTTPELQSSLNTTITTRNGTASTSTVSKPATTLKLAVVSGSRFFVANRKPKDEEDEELEPSEVLT